MSSIQVSSIQAKCLCGRTLVEVGSLSNELGACHCHMCRTWGGGPFLSVETKEAVRFSPKDNVKVFDSSQWAERGFCAECGTHLFYRLKGKDHYYLPAGLFENLNLTFDHQVFIDHKPEYYSFKADTKNLTSTEVFALFNES